MANKLQKVEWEPLLYQSHASKVYFLRKHDAQRDTYVSLKTTKIGVARQLRHRGPRAEINLRFLPRLDLDAPHPLGLARDGWKEVSRTTAREPIQTSCPICKMHGAGAVVVQVAMGSHPSALTKGVAKTL
jgi:hypothetical protein